MKNLLLILISSVFVMSFASCAKDDGMYGQPDGSQGPSGPQVSGNVTVTIGNSGPGGSAPVTPSLPINSAWVKYPVNIGSLVLFCPYMQPTEYYSVPLNISNTAVAGCVDGSTRSAINSQVASQGGVAGDWVLVSTIFLSCDYSAEQIVGFAPFRLMKDEKGESKFVKVPVAPVGFKEITKDGVSAWVKDSF